MAILQLVLRFEGNVGAYGTPVSCHPSPFFPLSLCSFILVPFAAMVYLRFLQFIGLNITSKNGRSKTTSNGPKSNNAWSDFIYDMEFPFGSVSKKAFSVSSSLQLGLSKDSSTTKQVIDASTYYTKGTKVQVKRQ